MSRSGFSDDGPDSQEQQWAMIRWQGQLASAIRGKRGQAFLSELVEALDAMPEKRLIAGELIMGAPAFIPPTLTKQVVPQVCAIGALGLKRGINLAALDHENYDAIGDAFGIAHQLVQQDEWMNDEGCYHHTPEQRWQYMRDWAVKLLRVTVDA